MVQDLFADSSDLAAAYRDIIATRCLTYSGFTILMYDYVLTFSMEVTYVWSHPTNVVSIIFLVNRYLAPVVIAVDLYDKSGLATDLTRRFCKYWFIIESILVVFSFSIIHALVAMRVSALHGQARWVVVLLVTAWCGYVISTYTLIGVGTTPLAATNVPTQPFNICATPSLPGLWVVWLPSLFFETLIVILTVVRVIRSVGCDNFKSTPVAYLMYRDVMASNSLLCLLDWVVAPPTLYALAKYFSHAICVTASSRLVLNLRSLGPMDVLSTTFDFSDQYEYEYSHSISEASIPQFGTFGFVATRRNHFPIDSYFEMGRILSTEKKDKGKALDDLAEAVIGNHLLDHSRMDRSS